MKRPKRAVVRTEEVFTTVTRPWDYIRKHGGPPSIQVALDRLHLSCGHHVDLKKREKGSMPIRQRRCDKCQQDARHARTA